MTLFDSKQVLQYVRKVVRGMKFAEKLGLRRKKPALIQIPTDCLVPNPLQPRHVFNEGELMRLSDSIRANGVLQPLCVKRRENVPNISINGTSVTAKAQYEIIAGERRWRAAKLAGLESVPCVLLEATAGESAQLALAENIFRSDLNYFEQAAAMQSIMLVCDLTQTELAKKLCLSQPTVANKLRLLKLSDEERRIISECDMPERVARALLRISDGQARLRLIKSAQAHSYTPEQCLRRIEALLSGAPRPAKPKKSATQRLVGAISDMRFFMNTVDKAINLASAAGFDVERCESDKGDYIELKLLIPKSKKVG